MTKLEIIELIKALAEVVKANSGWDGSSRVINEANEKIKELIKQL